MSDQYFTCPQCGGNHFGRDTEMADGVVKTLETVRCHDQNKTGCGWSGVWSIDPRTAACGAHGVDTSQEVAEYLAQDMRPITDGIASVSWDSLVVTDSEVAALTKI